MDESDRLALDHIDLAEAKLLRHPDNYRVRSHLATAYGFVGDLARMRSEEDIIRGSIGGVALGDLALGEGSLESKSTSSSFEQRYSSRGRSDTSTRICVRSTLTQSSRTTQAPRSSRRGRPWSSRLFAVECHVDRSRNARRNSFGVTSRTPRNSFSFRRCASPLTR